MNRRPSNELWFYGYYVRIEWETVGFIMLNVVMCSERYSEEGIKRLFALLLNVINVIECGFSHQYSIYMTNYCVQNTI